MLTNLHMGLSIAPSSPGLSCPKETPLPSPRARLLPTVASWTPAPQVCEQSKDGKLLNLGSLLRAVSLLFPLPQRPCDIGKQAEEPVCTFQTVVCIDLCGHSVDSARIDLAYIRNNVSVVVVIP